jgi:hypothetical protein
MGAQMHAHTYFMRMYFNIFTTRALKIKFYFKAKCVTLSLKLHNYKPKKVITEPFHLQTTDTEAPIKYLYNLHLLFL